MNVFGFHAKQGAGKTTAVEFMDKAFGRGVMSKFGGYRCSYEMAKVNIKNTFTKYILPLFDDIGINPFENDDNLAMLKRMQLAFSTTAEQHINPRIWSNIWYKMVMDEEIGHCGAIFTDDIRSTMNVDAMVELSKAFQIMNEQEEHENRILEENNSSRPYLPNQVHLIALECPREIRKQRIPESQWRPEDNYTEMGVDLSVYSESSTFKIHRIDTSQSKEHTQEQIHDLIGKILE